MERSETELELTAERAVKELTQMFQLAGRLQATAIVSKAPDVLHPACDKAGAALRHFVDRVESMPEISVDRYADSSQKAAAAGERRLRRGWLNQVQRLLKQVEEVRGGDTSESASTSIHAATGSEGVARIGRALAGPHPTSAELVSASTIRSVVAEPNERGMASLTGKILTDPTLVVALGSGIESNVQTLLSLSLSSCELSDEALDVLGPALQEHPTLMSLDLSDNRLSGAGAEALVAYVLAPEEPGDKRPFKKMSEAKQVESGDLVHLSWEATTLTSVRDLQHETRRVVAQPGLQMLNLSDNPLGVNGSRAVGEALALNTSLQTVAMRSVGLGPNGASNLARFGIQRNCGMLATLDIARNKIGNAGAAALAASLRANPVGITSLDLTSNEIGHVGVASLAEVLGTVESKLQKLNLGGNPITCMGVAILAEEAGRAVAAGQRLPNGLRELLLANCELAPPPPMEAQSLGATETTRQTVPTVMGGAAADVIKQVGQSLYTRCWTVKWFSHVLVPHWRHVGELVGLRDVSICGGSRGSEGCWSVLVCFSLAHYLSSGGSVLRHLGAASVLPALSWTNVQ